MDFELTPLLIKFVLPLILNYLVKKGALTVLEAEGIEDLGQLAVFIKGLRTYQEYPSIKDGDFERMPPATTNLNRTPDA